MSFSTIKKTVPAGDCQESIDRYPLAAPIAAGQAAVFADTDNTSVNVSAAIAPDS